LPPPQRFFHHESTKKVKHEKKMLGVLLKTVSGSRLASFQASKPDRLPASQPFTTDN
jgi:hypothetical protein